MAGTAADYLPIVFTVLVAAGFVVTTLFVTHKLGPMRKTKKKLETFECGIEPQGNARAPFSVKYFLIAILFVLFDVEVIFMYPWAVNFQRTWPCRINRNDFFHLRFPHRFLLHPEKRRIEVGRLKKVTGHWYFRMTID